MQSRSILGVGAVLLALAGGAATANPVRDAVMAALAAEAKAANPGFAGFSAERGAAFYRASQTGGGPDTPSCTSCHGPDPHEAGRTRAGKAIAPMAVSKAPDRYTDTDKVALWFERNCKSVLGRSCTPQEKGDFLSFMRAQ